MTDVMQDVTLNDPALEEAAQPGRRQVLKIGLASLTTVVGTPLVAAACAPVESEPLITGQLQTFSFSRNPPDEFFTLTIAAGGDSSVVSVYRMGGTISLTAESGGVSIDRVDLTGELAAGFDRGTVRLTSAGPLEGRLNPGAAGAGFSGDFSAQGALTFTDGLNNAETLQGREGVELEGVQFGGRILSSDQLVITVRGDAALVNAVGGEVMAAMVDA